MKSKILLAALTAITTSIAAMAETRPAGQIANANIHTMNDAAPVAGALVWDTQGRIVAVGDTETLSRQFPGLEAVDLNGRTVIPGLIDAHAHLMNLGLARLQADLTGAETVEKVLERLQDHVQSLPEDAWLTGRGWDQNLWPGGKFPSAVDLDEAFPERPVWLTRIDGHAGWANSAAMARAEQALTGNWQPQGGYIHRDEDERPTGIFIDTAMRVVSAQIPEPDEEVFELALDLALEETARSGLTGIHEAGTSLEALRRYLHRAAAGKLPLRIYAMADGDQAMLAALCRLGPVTAERVTARAVKLYADGALGSRGAALIEDYADDTGNRGLLFESDQALQAQVDKAMECGLQVGIHAIGDRANRQVIDVLIAGQEKFPGNPGRHRVEHLQVIHPDDIPRLAEYGIIASMQPIHATSDMGWAPNRLGSERLAGAYAWQRVLSAGGRLAFGSDFPVEPVDPMLGIYAAVTRQDSDGNPPGGWLPDQRLSVMQALAGFTRDAAYAAFAQDQVGTLEVGKRADFVILNDDPAAVSASGIPNIQVLTTVIDGQPIYRHADSPL